jgi:hypothetical protein
MTTIFALIDKIEEHVHRVRSNVSDMDRALQVNLQICTDFGFEFTDCLTPLFSTRSRRTPRPRASGARG